MFSEETLGICWSLCIGDDVKITIARRSGFVNGFQRLSCVDIPDGQNGCPMCRMFSWMSGHQQYAVDLQIQSSPP